MRYEGEGESMGAGFPGGSKGVGSHRLAEGGSEESEARPGREAEEIRG